MSMLKWFESAEQGVVIVSLGFGDLLLESLRQVAREAQVHTGVVMTGLGCLSHGCIHWVATNVVPPRDEFADLEGPLEIIGLSGIIAGHAPHVHIALQDAAGGFHGGHLEEGCAILTLSEISILRTPDLRLTRAVRGSHPIPLLDQERARAG
jgi:predicted DNA-binding protein with PD1-like motif